MRRGQFVFLILNVIISAAVAFGIITLFGEQGDGIREVQVTFEVRVTQPPITPQIIIVTATSQPGTEVALAIPPDVLEGDAAGNATPIPTLDPNALDENGQPLDPLAQLPEGCIEYVVLEGDVPGSIATEFGVDLSTLLAINGLDDDSARFLQIGDALIIPLESCPIDQFITQNQPDVSDSIEVAEETPEITEEAITSTPTPSPTARATVTLAPTAESARIELGLVGAGDITSEEVEITNNGNTVNIAGWTLSDSQNNAYTFPEKRLFSGATILVRTRIGDDTNILTYWNRDTAVFEPGDVVILSDTNGIPQASIRVP